MFQLPEGFRLHDCVRRRICMTAFFALCVAPTLLVLAWGVSRRLPWRASWEASSLGRELGLDVSLEKVHYLRPGLVLYEGLQLADPETGRELFRCKLVEAFWGRPTDPKGPAAKSLAMVVSEPEIEAAGLTQVVELVGRGLAQRTSWSNVEIRFRAAEVRLRSADPFRKLTGLEGFLCPVTGGSQGQIDFRVAGIPTTEPVRIRLGRDRSQSPPQTGLEFYTGGSVLPCSLLALGFPGLKHLGPSSGLRGYLWVNQQPEGWAYGMTGELTGLDLESVAADCSPHKLSGTAQVTVELARVVGGRLQDAAGTVQAGPGMVSRSLLEAAAESLGLGRGAEPATTAGLVPYTQLGLSLQIDSAGLRVRGLCPGPGAGTIMADTSGRLLCEPDPRSQPVPIAALVRTLSPPSRVHVPLTQTADRMMRVLPIPDDEAPGRPETAMRPPPTALGEPFERR